jgi:hypothetical protein
VCQRYSELELKEHEMVFQFKTSNCFQLQLSFEKFLLDVLYEEKLLVQVAFIKPSSNLNTTRANSTVFKVYTVFKNEPSTLSPII